jgi:hypothetical protein
VIPECRPGERRADRHHCLIGGLPLIEAMHDELRTNGRGGSRCSSSRQYHQHDRRKPVDHHRRKGPKPGDRYRVHDLEYCLGEAAKSIRLGEADV